MRSQPIQAPLISAIIPIGGFANGTKQIEEWITNPDLTSFEIILVIDTEDIQTKKQTQKVAEILEKITAVKILNSQRRNPGGTRNIGLSSALGTWVVFWDSDDVPNPSKVLQMVIEAEKINADVSLGEFTVKCGSSQQVRRFPDTDSENTLKLVAVNPGLWRFAFRTSIAKMAKFREISMAEDQIYLSEVLTHSKKMNIFYNCIYEYWSYPTGQITQNSAAMMDLIFSLKVFVKKFKICRSVPILIVILRLTVTVIKKADVKSKIKALLIFLTIPILYPIEIPNIWAALLVIWRNR